MCTKTRGGFARKAFKCPAKILKVAKTTMCSNFGYTQVRLAKQGLGLTNTFPLHKLIGRKPECLPKRPDKMELR